jgi:flavin reductase (DIM6/NTAB) family NADH-FMN oxidoreductase RutF
MHVATEPAILYFGTPVVLISTVSEDGSYNLAPMSSAFWLGWRCILGLDASSKTTQNLLRTGECVLNLPSEENVAAVDRLALTTGSDPVPSHKRARGYRYERDKFGASGLTADPSETVAAPRVHECPVQLEATLTAAHGLAEDHEMMRGRVRIFEVRVRRVHVQETLLMQGEPNRIDPGKWRPLIMSFQKYYGLAPEELHGSRLGTVPEELYRSPEVSARVRRQAN